MGRASVTKPLMQTRLANCFERGVLMKRQSIMIREGGLMSARAWNKRRVYYNDSYGFGKLLLGRWFRFPDAKRRAALKKPWFGG